MIDASQQFLPVNEIIMDRGLRFKVNCLVRWWESEIHKVNVWPCDDWKGIGESPFLRKEKVFAT